MYMDIFTVVLKYNKEIIKINVILQQSEYISYMDLQSYFKTFTELKSNHNEISVIRTYFTNFQSKIGILQKLAGIARLKNY